MGRLLRFLLISTIITVGTPAAVVGLMYDGSGENDMPVHLYSGDMDAEAMLRDELANSIEELLDETADDLVYELHEDIINVAIFQQLKEMNPDYMPTESCEEEDCMYVAHSIIGDGSYRAVVSLAGAWVEFEEDTFVFNAYLKVETSDISYKTVVELHFGLKDTTESYYLDFKKMNIGNLPIPKALIGQLLSFVDKRVDNEISTELDGIELGTASLKDVSYTLKKQDIIDYLKEDIENGNETEGNPQELAVELLSIIFEKRLIEFKVTEDEFTFTGGISRIESEDVTDIPDYLYETHDDNGFNPELFDLDSYMEDKFTRLLFNYSLDNELIFDEKTINTVIYTQADGFEKAKSDFEYTDADGETKSVEFGLETIWLDIEDGEININLLFKIAGKSSVLQVKSNRVTEDEVMGELKFALSEITIGKDEGEDPMNYILFENIELIQEALSKLGNIEVGRFDEDGSLVLSASKITELLSKGTQDEVINVTSIDIRQDEIVLLVEASNPELQDILTSYTNEVERVLGSDELLTSLDSVLDTENEGIEQELYEEVVAIQEIINNPNQELSVDNFNDMFEIFEDLNDETKEDFMQSFEDNIDMSIFEDFEDAFSQIDTNDIPVND